MSGTSGRNHDAVISFGDQTECFSKHLARDITRFIVARRPFSISFLSRLVNARKTWSSLLFRVCRPDYPACNGSGRWKVERDELLHENPLTRDACTSDGLEIRCLDKCVACVHPRYYHRLLPHGNFWLSLHSRKLLLLVKRSYCILLTRDLLHSLQGCQIIWRKLQCNMGKFLI